MFPRNLEEQALQSFFLCPKPALLAIKGTHPASQKDTPVIVRNVASWELIAEIPADEKARGSSWFASSTEQVPARTTAVLCKRSAGGSHPPSASIIS
jgi:hypothetical protein